MNAAAEDVTPALFREAVKEATRAPIKQNRCLARLKAVLRFARTEQKIQQLPALIGMRRPHVETRRERVLTQDEIGALWRVIDEVAVALPRGGPAFAASVRLMLLIGTRLGETSLATWQGSTSTGNAQPPLDEKIPEDHGGW